MLSCSVLNSWGNRERFQLLSHSSPTSFDVTVLQHVDSVRLAPEKVVAEIRTLACVPRVRNSSDRMHAASSKPRDGPLVAPCVPAAAGRAPPDQAARPASPRRTRGGASFGSVRDCRSSCGPHPEGKAPRSTAPYELGTLIIPLFSSYATASDAGVIPARATTPDANARIVTSLSRTTAPGKLAHHRRYGRPAQQRTARADSDDRALVTLGTLFDLRRLAVGLAGRSCPVDSMSFWQ